MRHILKLAMGAAVLSGCATKEMKSTPFYEGGEVTYVGEASERVNLWPIAYWRNPVGAVAWPVMSFSDDHFAFRPVYSQYKQKGPYGDWDEFNFVWPIVQADVKDEDYRVFPVFWGKDREARSYQTVFPIYWNGANYNSLFPLWYYGSGEGGWTFHTIAGLAGARQEEAGDRCSWMFPLWYEDNTGYFSTLIYGQTKDSHWVFPLWYKGEKAFVSSLYAQGEDENKSWWSVPLAFSWGMTRNVTDDEIEIRQSEGSILLGFGGWSNATKKSVEKNNWWAFPFIHRWSNIPMDTTRESTAETYIVDYLSGWETRGDELTSLYVFPLFSWNEDGSWLTLLGGELNSCGTTNTLATPLVCMTSGRKKGGYVFPVWWHEKDADFDEKIALLDSPTLPDCIEVTTCTENDKESEHYGKSYLDAQSFSGFDSTSILLHDVDHLVYSCSFGCYDQATNTYSIAERYKRGNLLLLNYVAVRDVAFDLKTKAKLSDDEESEASFLLFLYQYDWCHDRMKGDEYTRHRVLWRLWDWEEKDGDVSLDVFPGFTYDSREDGYTKTSFWWRLFRYESDPTTGTSVDFLFIPVWR